MTLFVNKLVFREDHLFLMFLDISIGEGSGSTEQAEWEQCRPMLAALGSPRRKRSRLSQACCPCHHGPRRRYKSPVREPPSRGTALQPSFVRTTDHPTGARSLSRDSHRFMRVWKIPA